MRSLSHAQLLATPRTAAYQTPPSMGFKESQLNDTGNYTMRVDAINDTQRASVWLEIQGEWAAAPLPNCTELNLEVWGVVFLGAHSVLVSTCPQMTLGVLVDGSLASPQRRDPHYVQTLQVPSIPCCVTNRTNSHKLSSLKEHSFL